MESQAWLEDLWAAVSASLPDDERIAATMRLGRLLDRQAFDALCTIAGRPGESDALYRAAGESAARVAAAIGAIDEAPLHDFYGPAYLGFDAVIAAHLKGDAVT